MFIFLNTNFKFLSHGNMWWVFIFDSSVVHVLVLKVEDKTTVVLNVPHLMAEQ